MGNCNHSPNIPPLQKLDSCEYVINNEDKANILNNFFYSITEIENSNVPTPDFHDRTGNRIDNLHITSDEVKDILECLQVLPEGKCGHRNELSKRQVWMSIFHIINLKKKIMDTGDLNFFNNKLILDNYFCLKSGPVFLFQIFIIAPLPLPRDIQFINY